jgi:hypothetical protein
MKKVILYFALASMFVACNKPAQKPAEAQDSVATETVAPVDTTMQADSTATPADSTAAVK